MLKRAIWTWHSVAEELNLHWIPHYKDWRLNEKHYGALQGFKKDMETKTISKKDLEDWR